MERKQKQRRTSEIPASSTVLHGADRFISQVYFNELNSNVWQSWKLVPMRVEGTTVPSQSSLGSLPRYDEDEPWQSSSHVEQAESECDPFGTVVTKVTIVTTLKRRTKDP